MEHLTNINKTICRLCFKSICHEKFTSIDENIKEVIGVLFTECSKSRLLVRKTRSYDFVSQDLNEKNKYVMCNVCRAKLFAALNFKAKCMDTEDLLFPYLQGMQKGSLLDLWEIYHGENNTERVNFQSHGKVCRLCMQILEIDYVSVEDISFDFFSKFLPEMNLSCTKDPIVCKPCFNSLSIHGDFLRKCEKLKEKDYVKIQSEEQHLDCAALRTRATKTRTTKEKTRFKSCLERKQATSKVSSGRKKYKCNSCTFVSTHKAKFKKHCMLHQNDLEVQVYKCDECNFKTKYKGHLPKHLSKHKEASQVQMYKCDHCNHEARDSRNMFRHKLTHADPSQVQMYACDICQYKAKYKQSLKTHVLYHKDPSHVQMFKCDLCDYVTKSKGCLSTHQLIHKDSSQVQMYGCNDCDFKARYKSVIIRHQLVHKDPSQVQMYKCDVCDHETKLKYNLYKHQLTHESLPKVKCNDCNYETKSKRCLRQHMLKHKDPSEVHTYKCSSCDYQTIFKHYFRKHQLLHKDPSEVHMHKCEICGYKTKRKDCLKLHYETKSHKDREAHIRERNEKSNRRTRKSEK